MKTFLKIITSTSLILLLLFTTSCAFIITPKGHDNGKHKGWFKNPQHQSHSKNKAKDNKGHSKHKKNKHK